MQQVPLYFGVTWDGTFNLCYKLEEKLLLMKTEQDTDGGNKQLSLNVRADKSESCHVIIYAPYWIINKTGLPVQIKVNNFFNPRYILTKMNVISLLNFWYYNSF